MNLKRLKDWAGILFFDVYRYEKALRRKSNQLEWLGICNRAETFSECEETAGLSPNWRWSSELHAIRFVPSWGRRLMERALEQFPINISPLNSFASKTANPEVTFIIGHRGEERLPLLQSTIKSIENQTEACVEIIVVEESFCKTLEAFLPEGVRYLHLPISSPDQPYNRSRTFNEGAKLALGRLLVFHDNDLLVPESYAAELLRQLDRGYEVINLKRFIFYLSKSHTNDIIDSKQITIRLPDLIKQNSTGGGSIAILPDAFNDIGGFDEGFVGWGGEDLEFWDRAQLLKVCNFGFLSMLHLWHSPQFEKSEKELAIGLKRLEKVLEIKPNLRVQELEKARKLSDPTYSINGHNRIVT